MDENRLVPLWQGDTVYEEFITVFEDVFGEIRPFRLAYPVRELLSVTSADRAVSYKEEVSVNAFGELEIARGGEIPFLPWREYRLPAFEPKDGILPAADGLGSYRVEDLFADREGLRAYQLAVTYRHAPSGAYAVVPAKREKFPRTLRKCAAGEEISVVGYGDSITYGWGSSGMKDVRRPPYCPPYAELVAAEIGARGGRVRFTNCAVSGMCTDWGEKSENLAPVIVAKPDLVLLAFGMNDAGVFRPEEFRRRILAIIDKIRARVPSAEFVLVSPILPNPNIGFSLGSSVYHYHAEYPDALKSAELARERTALADVGEVHRLLLKRKSLYDTLSNGINHPNDFMHRVYAQVVLKTVFG